jgi:hypothetical protein
MLSVSGNPIAGIVFVLISERATRMSAAIWRIDLPSLRSSEESYVRIGKHQRLIDSGNKVDEADVN